MSPALSASDNASRLQAPGFSLSGATLGYGSKQVLHDLDLAVSPGETLALVGASGCGKSTLLTQLYRQQADHCAWCPQDLGLVRPLSVYHNIYMGQLHNHGLWYNLANLVRPFRHHRQRIAQLADTLGLSEQLFRSIDRLSGGQQQRVAIGRALYRHQPVFLGDEPFASLDQRQGRHLLETIKARHQITVIALHDRQMALDGFDRVIGLRNGRIHFDSPTASLTQADLDTLYEPA